MRFIFSKYANSGFNLNNPNTFQDLMKQTGQISIAEIRKMLNDFELEHRITKEEVQALAREVHIRILREKTEFKIFEFHGFQHFIV